VGKQLSQLEGGEAQGLSTPKSGTVAAEGDGDDPPKDNGGASTPQWLFDYCNQLAVQACGEPITLDVAAADWNNKCERYFTEETDALMQEWNAKAVFCNPPFSATIIESFVRKALDAAQHGTTSFFLLPWWNYPYLDLCERHGRIHRICSPVCFQRQDGSTLTMNNQYRTTPLVIVVFGPTITTGCGTPIRKGDTPDPLPGDDIDAKGGCERVATGSVPPLITGDGNRCPATPELTDEDRQRRQRATTLTHGNATEMLKTLSDAMADVILFDPPYPGIKRPYGTMTEEEWHKLMESVLRECHRILKPTGSTVVVLQPNYEKVGRMRLWPWKFVCWASSMWPDWGLVEDVYSFTPNALPSAGVERENGLLRKAIKWCVWLGRPDCYRNQDAVLQEPKETTIRRLAYDRLETFPSGSKVCHETFRRVLQERGGVTPSNFLIVPTGTPIDQQGHPAVTPYRLAEWWCRYLLPPNGVLIDPFCGSGTTLAAAFDCGASQVIGIDKREDYLEIARRRIFDNKECVNNGRQRLAKEQLLLEGLAAWIEDADLSGEDQRFVEGIWDRCTGLDRKYLKLNVQLLADAHREMWQALGSGRPSA
jgi:phage N-6-adenine-methyltransferase